VALWVMNCLASHRTDAAVTDTKAAVGTSGFR
jgi:hypothetical protein